MFKRRKMRFNGEWSLLAGNRVYELSIEKCVGGKYLLFSLQILRMCSKSFENFIFALTTIDL
jgi:hypothetical protein